MSCDRELITQRQKKVSYVHLNKQFYVAKKNIKMSLTGNRSILLINLNDYGN